MTPFYKNKSIETLPGEVWRAIPLDDYRHLFQVSNLGRVKKVTEVVAHRYRKLLKDKTKILAQNTEDRGYCKSDLCVQNHKKSVKVHRMVAMAFLGQAPDGYDQVNHINGNKSDNRVENLEWSNNSLNITHAWATGLFKPKTHIGAAHKLSTIIMHAEYGTFYSIQEVAKLENINRRVLSKMIRNQRQNTTKYIAA